MVSGLRPWQDLPSRKETWKRVRDRIWQFSMGITKFPPIDPRRDPFFTTSPTGLSGLPAWIPRKCDCVTCPSCDKAWLPLPFLHLFFSSWRPNANEVTRQRVIEMNSKPTLNFRMERQETTFNRMTSHSNNSSSNRVPCGKVFWFECSSSGWFRICFVAGSKLQIPPTQRHRRTFLRRIKR